MSSPGRLLWIAGWRQIQKRTCPILRVVSLEKLGERSRILHVDHRGERRRSWVPTSALLHEREIPYRFPGLRVIVQENVALEIAADSSIENVETPADAILRNGGGKTG